MDICTFNFLSLLATFQNPPISTFGKQEVIPHSFPFQAQLIILVFQNGEILERTCGGSLISQNFVLSAAHCFKDYYKAYAYMGNHINVQNFFTEWSNTQQIPIELVTTHEDFNFQTSENDLALAKLKQTVILNQYVQPIRLPTYEMSFMDLKGYVVTGTGWGRKFMYSKRLSNVLQSVNVKIVHNNYCNSLFYNLPDYIAKLDNAKMCAKADSVNGLFKADSGGPVFVKLGNEFVQVGVTSFLISNNINDKALGNILIKTSYYLSWIDSHSDVQIAFC